MEREGKVKGRRNYDWTGKRSVRAEDGERDAKVGGRGVGSIFSVTLLE